MHGVIETPQYLSDAKAAGLTGEDLDLVCEVVARNPTAGVLIPGAGGARKIRFAGKGKGKSGGYRVITYYGGGAIPVFLLNVFAKGDIANLTKAERNTLKRILADLADAYRQGAAVAARSANRAGRSVDEE